MPGLSVSDVVNVQVNMSPLAVPVRNFGSLCIAGPSDVIDTKERIRLYATLTAVTEDFGASSPEYLAADLFFSQAPRPALLYIGRFAQTATHGVLHGGIFSNNGQAAVLQALQGVTNGSMSITIDGSAQTVGATHATIRSAAFLTGADETLLTTLQAIANGGFAMTIDGTARQISPIDFTTGVTDLHEAAGKIQGVMATWAECTWDETALQFNIRSLTTGIVSTLSFATAPAAGTDISATLKLTAATGALPAKNGTAGMTFAGVTNLNGAATIIQSALTGAGCQWDGSRFIIKSLSSGPTSTVSYASPGGTGTNVSGVLRLTQATGAAVPVDGILAETPLEAAIALRQHPEWYGLMFATPDPLDDDDHMSVAEFIEGADPISIYGLTTQKTDCLDMTITTDLLSRLKGEVLERTFSQFSSESPYACASIFGRAFTVDFEGSNTVITLKFKQEPGVQGEMLTTNQAAALRFKHGNVFVYYSNDVAIIQEGVMANGFFFDEVHGTDWQANRVQTDVFNLLYQSTTKIPQTNAGVHMIVTVVENALSQGVVNGLLAPGQWNAAGFGQLNFGQMLPKGYYVWAPLLESQPQSIREQRIAPTIQCALKLAGAVHKANVILTVNR